MCAGLAAVSIACGKGLALPQTWSAGDVIPLGRCHLNAMLYQRLPCQRMLMLPEFWRSSYCLHAPCCTLWLSWYPTLHVMWLICWLYMRVRPLMLISALQRCACVAGRARQAILLPPRSCTSFATAAKVKTSFVCSDCGAEHSKWSGKCSSCGVWDTLKAFRPSASVVSVYDHLRAVNVYLCVRVNHYSLTKAVFCMSVCMLPT